MRSRTLNKLFFRGNPKQFRRFFSLHKLSQKHLILQKTCREFAETELKPVAALLDCDNKFPTEQIKKLGDLGLLGINASEKWGGCAQDNLATVVAVEEIARGCAGTGAIVSIHNCLYVNLLDRCGTERQKEEFLQSFTCGTLGCFALSEPEAGSDVCGLSTTALQDGDHYILNGTKSWVTSGPEGRAAIVFATIDKNLKHDGITAFLIPIPTPGLTVGPKEHKMGIRASSTCNFVLEDVAVHKDNILGAVGSGFKMAMEQLDNARVGIAAQALGIAQAALEVALKYASERVAFDKQLNSFQAVKMRLADMALKLEGARLLVWRAAILLDEPCKCTKEASMAKLAASQTATFVAHNAVQILGGMGYITGTPAERHFRDARVTEIYGGVTDIQKLVVGDSIIKEYA